MKNRELLSMHQIWLNPEIFLSPRKAGYENWSEGRKATLVAHLENFTSCLLRPDFITLELIFKL